jgi:putative tricarboxylic transport membrane protein
VRPEAANNAAATGTLVPLLTLGIPTSATAAILLSAFQNYGIQPGPLLFQTQGALVWGLIASLYVGNVILLVLNLPLIGIWVRVLAIPRPLLYGGILLFATLGAYSLHQSWVDLATLYVFGLLGFAMRRWDIPVAPAIIGLILGPLAETQFRRALRSAKAMPTVLGSRSPRRARAAVAAVSDRGYGSLGRAGADLRAGAAAAARAGAHGGGARAPGSARRCRG